ncbi:DUF2894 domain-containing protein [Haliea sp. E17]|uniref:DUF2894 domain-containing protein n=1 Tax=Haliea sp. E17 TaxID=3401576 RepID=UPI003AAEB011
MAEAQAQLQLAELVAEIAQLAQSGASRFDPARFCFLQRQAERLQQQRYCSQRSLQRLAEALADYRQRLQAARDQAGQALDAITDTGLHALFDAQDFRALLRRLRRPPVSTPLRQLGQRRVPLEDSPARSGNPLQLTLKAQESALLDTHSTTSPTAQAPREIRALGRARAARRERHRRERIANALTRTPSDAGPLNSHRLVTRAIRTLQDLSPAYLDHFINHVETLMELEKLANRRSG